MKKVKLFLSTSMVCLCITVLCFGVLAATSVTYSISGTVSYEVTDVFAKINTSIFKVAEQTSITDMKTNIDTLATSKLSEIGGSSTTASSSLKYIATDISVLEYDTSTFDSVGGESEFDIALDSTYMTYYIVINIKNEATKSVNAKLTDTTTYTNLNVSKKSVQNNIAKDETRNIVVAFSLADKKEGITGDEMNYSLELSYTQYEEPKAFKLELIDGGAYWYATLGSYNWRLVSLDGTTRYEYQPTKPTEHYGAIFVQNAAEYKIEFDGNGSSTYNRSSIQEYLEELATFGTDNEYGITSDPRCIATYSDSSETNGVVDADKFWLLSKTQAETFFLDNTDRIYKAKETGTSYYWWLRTPQSSNSAYYVSGNGVIGSTKVNDSPYAVRAAFQHN